MQNTRVLPFLIALLGWMSFLFLLLPLVALLMHVPFGLTFANWKQSGQSPLLTSVWTTLTSMGVIVVMGTPLGWSMARGKRRIWRTVEVLMLVPLLIPPLVVGLLLVYFYGPNGFIGAWLSQFGLAASNSGLAVVLAQLYEAAPYYIFAAQAAFLQVDNALERASYSLGVGPIRTFTRVTFPLARSGLAVGFAMAFARAIGSFGAVIVVAYYPHTLPVSIWIALQEQGLSAALPLALLLLLVSLPLPILTFILRRGKRRDFVSL